MVVVLSVMSTSHAQQTELADPLPSFDEPRKIILQLSSEDEGKMNDILYNAVNLQKFYGMDNVRIRIVAFGRGMKALYDKESPVRDRIKSLLKYDVEFIGCGNTMDATQHTPADLIDGVSWVQAGIAEVVESNLRGWTYIHP
jgi:hypothetical protein